MDIIISYTSFIFIGGIAVGVLGGILVGLAGIYIVLAIRIKND